MLSPLQTGTHGNGSNEARQPVAGIRCVASSVSRSCQCCRWNELSSFTHCVCDLISQKNPFYRGVLWLPGDWRPTNGAWKESLEPSVSVPRWKRNERKVWWWGRGVVVGGHDHCGKQTRYTDMVLRSRSAWASWDRSPQISEGFEMSETR